MNRLLFGLFLVAGVAAILGVALGMPGESQSRSAAQPGADAVYKLLITAREGEARYQWTEWISARTGAWRMKDGDRIRIYDGRRTHVVLERGRVDIRRGSRAFLGYLKRGAVGLRAIDRLRRQTRSGSWRKFGSGPQKVELRINRGTIPATVTLADVLSAKQSERLGLFDVPARPTTIALERAPGQRPANGVRGYWLGPAQAGREAVTAIEFTTTIPAAQRWPGMERKNTRVYMVFYERPDVPGIGSAAPGRYPPAGEIQVVSQPMGIPATEAAIQAFNGVNGDLRYDPWPRFDVKLRNGETATVVPHRGDRIAPDALGRERFSSFAVITRQSLVNVIATLTESEIRALAAQLTPASG